MKAKYNPHAWKLGLTAIILSAAASDTCRFTALIPKKSGLTISESGKAGQGAKLTSNAASRYRAMCCTRAWRSRRPSGRQH